MKRITIPLLLFFLLTTTAFNALASDYQQYLADFEAINSLAEAEKFGFEISDFNLDMTDNLKALGIYVECSLHMAVHKQHGRVALFFADTKGNVLYKTENLECNNFFAESLYQPNVEVAAITARDLNEDGYMDILLVTRCLDNGNKFKIGDVLIQDEGIFYRDWRISDKINRFSMNKDLDMMTAFVRDGQSAEFLYTASTLDELEKGGFEPLAYQSFDADFEKFGEVKVVPGTYYMGGHYIFILYLVNGDGQIVWNFQCMRDYDNFSNMTGISFKDVDGDGWADLSVLARYITLDDNNIIYSATDFSIYYQRDGYFFEDREFHDNFIGALTGEEIMDDIVQAARKYWGW